MAVSDRALYLHAARSVPQLLDDLLRAGTVTPQELASTEDIIRQLYELEARRAAAGTDRERALAAELVSDCRTVLLARIEKNRILARRAQREALVETIAEAALKAAPAILGALA